MRRQMRRGAILGLRRVFTRPCGHQRPNHLSGNLGTEEPRLYHRPQLPIAEVLAVIVCDTLSDCCLDLGFSGASVEVFLPAPRRLMVLKTDPRSFECNRVVITLFVHPLYLSPRL